MKHLTKSHRVAGNVLIVLKFQQTLFGTQTNPMKSQRKLKIGPTLGYHILDVPMPCCFILYMVVFLSKGFIRRNYVLCNQEIFDYKS
jgi:hypothetical protein